MTLTKDEQDFIRTARGFLDRPGLLLRLAGAAGRPIEVALRALPARHQRIVARASEKALQKALATMIQTLRTTKRAQTFSHSGKRSRTLGRWHTLASFSSGAIGGIFGILSLPIELPVSTAIMLRSIAGIAAEFGMDLEDPLVQMECLYILSLGSAPNPQPGPEGATQKSAYWTSRLAFANLGREAAAFVSGKGGREVLHALEKRTAPALVKFMTAVAARFEIVVSEKLLAEAVPILGALGGGTINAAFTNYFNETARYHFGLKALERKHGREVIEMQYNQPVRN